MEKEELLELANNIFEEAFMANSYWEIIKQYGEESNKYLTEMNLSPAFFKVSYRALMEALFMKLAKIYDVGENTLGIKFLLEQFKKGIQFFPNEREFSYRNEKDEVIVVREPYKHKFKPEEEKLFHDNKEIQDEIKKIKVFCEYMGMEYDGTDIDMSIEEFLELYQRKHHALHKIEEKLRIQRNNVYAHNLEKINFKFEDVCKKNPLVKDEIDALLDYAFDICDFVIGMLSGEARARKATNIDDMGNVLKYAHIGFKYREQYWDEKYGKI